MLSLVAIGRSNCSPTIKWHAQRSRCSPVLEIVGLLLGQEERGVIPIMWALLGFQPNNIVLGSSNCVPVLVYATLSSDGLVTSPVSCL